MLPCPVLLADIGGTYVRFAVLADPAQAPSPLWKVETADFTGPTAAIRAYGDRRATIRPRSAFLAVAGKVDGAITRLTNAPWQFDPCEIGKAIGLDAVRLVNDYVPLAAVLTVLDEAAPADLVRIGGGAERTGTRLVIGPGTGLGAAALIPAGDRFLIQTTEAGHIGFGPCARDDDLPWSGLLPAVGRLTAEAVLSGPGLVRLARAIGAARGLPTAWEAPSEILTVAGTDAVAGETVRHFTHLLGRFAGDMALVFSATGGVVLAGGIAPRIIAALRTPGFHAAFEDKSPFRNAMRGIPRFVISRPEPSIDGLATLVRDGARFLFPSRDWRRVEADQGPPALATAG